MERQILIVSGHVQGVGFRYHVHKHASREGLTGFVRNLDNGDVYIEVQGERDKIRQFLAFIRTSIPFATVISVEASPAELVGDEDLFKVKY